MAITKEAIIKLLGDRPVAYHPILAKALSGVVEAVFVSQLLYWYGRGKLEDNWIWKTQEEWTQETGLTRSNQETARRNLKKLGILKEKRKGVPGKMHFQLDLDRLADLLTMLDSDIVETPQSRMPKPSNAQSQDSAINNAEMPQCIPETTTETPIDDNIDLDSSSPAPSPQPPALDGQQRAVDHASGGTALDPVQEVAKHLRWLCSGQGVSLPSSAAGKKPYLKAARALLEKTDPADWQGVCFAVDDWGEHPPQADEWRRDRTKEPGFSLDHIAAHYWKIRNRPEPEEFVLITKDTSDPLASWWRDQQPLLVQFKAALVGAAPVSKENGTLVLMVPDSGREQLAQGGRLEKMESALGLAVEVVAGGPGREA